MERELRYLGTYLTYDRHLLSSNAVVRENGGEG